MEWLFIFIAIAVLVNMFSGKSEKLSDHELKQIAMEMAAEAISTAKLNFTTGKGSAPTQPEKGDETVYRSINPSEQIQINGEPTNTFDEDCDSCGKSFIVFYAGSETPKELKQIYCPFCGKIHDYEEEEVNK